MKRASWNKIGLVVISLIAVLWVVFLNIPAGNVYYEFQFSPSSMEQKVSEKVELEVLLSKKAKKAPVESKKIQYLSNNMVDFQVEPRIYQNNGLKLKFFDDTDRKLIKVVVFEKQNNGEKELGSLSGDELNRHIDYLNNQIFLSKEGSEKLSSDAQDNKTIKVLLISLILLTDGIFLLPRKQRKYAVPIYAFLILAYFIWGSPNAFDVGKMYNYHSGGDIIDLQPGESFSQDFKVTKKRLSGIEFDLQLAETSEEAAQEPLEIVPEEGVADTSTEISEDVPEELTIEVPDETTEKVSAEIPKEIPSESNEELIDNKPQGSVELYDKTTGKLLKKENIDEDSFSSRFRLDLSRISDNLLGDQLKLVVKNFSEEKVVFSLVVSEKTSPVIQASSEGSHKLEVNLLYNTYPVKVVGLIILSVLIFVYIILILDHMILKKWSGWKVIVYLLFLFLFILQVTVLSDTTEKNWDEGAHLSFLTSLEIQPDKIVPDYEHSQMSKEDKSMKLLDEENELRGPLSFGEDSVYNYQVHPPLYYHLLRWMGGIKKIDSSKVEINYSKVLFHSQLIAYLSIALWFLIGALYIKKRLVYHVLYAGALTGFVPLLYASAQVNNDMLTLIASGLVVLALARFVENKYDFFGYTSLAVGLSIALLTKMTAGAGLVMASLLFLIWQLKKKNYRIIHNRWFYLTVIIYLIPIIYYIKMYQTYHSFMPSYQSLHADEFYQSYFYTPLGQREEILNLTDFLVWFIKNLFFTYQPLLGQQIDTTFYLNAVWVFLYGTMFILFFAASFIRAKIYEKKWNIIRVCSMGAWFFLINLFLNTFKRYYADGYLGGVQSRYFSYFFPLMAMVFVWGLGKMFRRLRLSWFNETIWLYFISFICTIGAFLIPFIMK